MVACGCLLLESNKDLVVTPVPWLLLGSSNKGGAIPRSWSVRSAASGRKLFSRLPPQEGMLGPVGLLGRILHGWGSGLLAIQPDKDTSIRACGQQKLSQLLDFIAKKRTKSYST